MPKTPRSPVHGKTVKKKLDPMQLLLIAGIAGAVAAMAAVSITAYRYAIQPGDLAEPLLVVEPFLPKGLGGAGALLLIAVLGSRLKREWRQAIPWRLAPIALLLLGAGVAGWPDGAFYAPIELWHWSTWFAANDLLLIRQESLIAFGIGWAAIAVGLIAAAKPGLRKTTGSHGTASWGEGEEMKRRGGFVLGRDLEEGDLYRWETDGHLLTVARTRSGKGVGCIIPNLLDYEGPVFVTDPKGENFKVCGRYRKEHFGQDVVALDPFRLVTQRPGALTDHALIAGTLNVLGTVPNDAGAVIEAANLTAEMLVIKSGKGEASFWDTEAEAWLASLTLYTMAEHYYRFNPIYAKGRFQRPTAESSGTLVRVRELLSLDSDGMEGLLQAMRTSTAYEGRVAAAAARFESKADKERSGVVSTAQSHTHFIETPQIAAVLSNTKHQISLQGLLDGRLSLFLVLPASRLDAYSRWQRLVVASVLRTITDSPTKPKKRVLILLDEFANLQRMEPVRRAVSLLAGFGASLWIFIQDLSQLKTLYGDGHETFIANAEVFQVFGTADVATAKYVSERAGDTTVFTETESQTRGSSKKGGGTRNRSRNTSEKGRRLITPDEVLTESGTTQLLFVAGEKPLRSGKVRYYADPEFKGKFDPADAKVPRSNSAGANGRPLVSGEPAPKSLSNTAF